MSFNPLITRWRSEETLVRPEDGGKSAIVVPAIVCLNVCVYISRHCDVSSVFESTCSTTGIRLGANMLVRLCVESFKVSSWYGGAKDRLPEK